MGCDKSVFNENSPNMRHAVSKKIIFPQLHNRAEQPGKEYFCDNTN